MKIHRKSGKSLFLALGFIGLGMASTAHAGTPVYLSGNGNDSNPCNLQQPCRLLPAALAAVTSGGEVVMLDSADYNTGEVTISQNVTILAVPGAVGGILVDYNSAGGVAINIASGPTVTLRNLHFHQSETILGASSFFVGVLAGSAVLNIFASDFEGVDTGVLANAGANVSVSQSTFRGGKTGISFDGTSTSFVQGVIDQSTVVSNSNAGIYAIYANIAVSHSNLSNNYCAVGPSTKGLVRLDNDIISGNHYGIYYGSSTQVQTTGSNNFFNNYVDMYGGVLTTVSTK